MQQTLPRVAGDLDRWRNVLNNCLAGYGPAAARGSTSILGILRGDQLRYAVEITAGREIHQLVGPANREPEPWVRATITGALNRRRILATTPRH